MKKALITTVVAAAAGAALLVGAPGSDEAELRGAVGPESAIRHAGGKAGGVVGSRETNRLAGGKAGGVVGSRGTEPLALRSGAWRCLRRTRYCFYAGRSLDGLTRYFVPVLRREKTFSDAGSRTPARPIVSA